MTKWHSCCRTTIGRTDAEQAEFPNNTGDEPCFEFLCFPRRGTRLLRYIAGGVIRDPNGLALRQQKGLGNCYSAVVLVQEFALLEP